MVRTDQALHHFLHRKDGVHPAGAVHPAIFRRETDPVRRKNNQTGLVSFSKKVHIIHGKHDSFYLPAWHGIFCKFSHAVRG